MLRGVNQVVLDVEDQQRAKKFWSEIMGCEVVEDEEYGEERWLAVLTPDGNTRLVLSLRQPGESARPAPADNLPNTNVFFYADDIEQTYKELTERGVRFPAPPNKQFFGWWSMFLDSEGNRFALGEKWGVEK